MFGFHNLISFKENKVLRLFDTNHNYTEKQEHHRYLAKFNFYIYFLLWERWKHANCHDVGLIQSNQGQTEF